MGALGMGALGETLTFFEVDINIVLVVLGLFKKDF